MFVEKNALANNKQSLRKKYGTEGKFRNWFSRICRHYLIGVVLTICYYPQQQKKKKKKITHSSSKIIIPSLK